MDIADLKQPDTIKLDSRANLEMLHEALSHMEREFSGEHARAAAHMLAEEQKQTHSRFIEVLTSSLSRLEDSRQSAELQSALRASLQRMELGVTEAPSALLSSNAPIISADSVIQIEYYLNSRRRDGGKAQSYLRTALVVTFYLRFAADLNIDLRINESGPFALALQRAMAIVEVFYQSRSLESHFVRHTTHLEEQTASTFVRINSLETSIAERRVNLEALLERLDAAQTSQDAIEVDLQEIPSRISAVETAMMAQLGLRETDKLWKNEAKYATRSYFWSSLALLAALIGLPVVVYIQRDSLLELIASIELAATLAANNNQNVLAAAVVVSRLTLIGLPVAMLIWALKLGVRFHTRSMLLMDDARHRVAMLNTFLFLLKQEAATIQDRGALLEALFRRTPGHGPETVEPPNLTDLMKYGEKIGTK